MGSAGVCMGTTLAGTPANLQLLHTKFVVIIGAQLAAVAEKEGMDARRKKKVKK